MKKKPKKKKRQALPSAKKVLTALAGVLALGSFYKRGACIYCNTKKGRYHHQDCAYFSAVALVLRYF